MRKTTRVTLCVGALLTSGTVWAQDDVDVPAATAAPADTADTAPATVAPETGAVGEVDSSMASAYATEGGVAMDEPVEHHPNDSGLELGVRGAYAIPLGEVSEGVDMTDQISGMIPLTLELGYRFNGHWYVGAYGTYGIGFSGDDCDADGVDCDGPTVVRVGGEVLYHIRDIHEPWSPFLGAGIGYEWLSTKLNSDVLDVEGTASGLEWFNVQAGVDLRMTDFMRLGPYFMYSMGQYTNVDVNDESADIDEKGTHHWLHFGVKGTFEFFGN